MLSARAGLWLCVAIKFGARREPGPLAILARKSRLTAESAAASSEVDLVIVATTHDVLAPLAARAARAGKHVLVEKPGARCAAELDPVADAAGQPERWSGWVQSPLSSGVSQGPRDSRHGRAR